MKRFFTAALLLSASAAFGQDYLASPAALGNASFQGALSFSRSTTLADATPTLSDAARKRWELSLIPLLAAHSLDAGSSWGHRETNAFLAGSDGGFGMKAAGIKFGLVGTAIVAEYFLMQHHPKLANFIVRANRTNAVLTTAFAAHNFIVLS
jgi:hypothetical protein